MFFNAPNVNDPSLCELGQYKGREKGRKEKGERRKLSKTKSRPQRQERKEKGRWGK